MATENQYTFYKLLYNEESSRGEQLRAQARNYLSLATLYSAFVVYVTEKALKSITVPLPPVLT